jgi:hypothetical protein
VSTPFDTVFRFPGLQLAAEAELDDDEDVDDPQPASRAQSRARARGGRRTDTARGVEAGRS